MYSIDIGKRNARYLTLFTNKQYNLLQERYTRTTYAKPFCINRRSQRYTSFRPAE